MLKLLFFAILCISLLVIGHGQPPSDTDPNRADDTEPNVISEQNIDASGELGAKTGSNVLPPAPKPTVAKRLDGVLTPVHVDPRCDVFAEIQAEVLQCEILSININQIIELYENTISVADDANAASPTFASAALYHKKLLTKFDLLAPWCDDMGKMMTDLILLNSRTYVKETLKNTRCTTVFRALNEIRNLNRQISQVIHLSRFVHDDRTTCKENGGTSTNSIPEDVQRGSDENWQLLPSVQICVYGGLTGFVGFVDANVHDAEKQEEVTLLVNDLATIITDLFYMDLLGTDLHLFHSWLEAIQTDVPDVITTSGVSEKVVLDNLVQNLRNDAKIFRSDIMAKLKLPAEFVMDIDEKIQALGENDITLDTILGYSDEAKQQIKKYETALNFLKQMGMKKKHIEAALSATFADNYERPFILYEHTTEYSEIHRIIVLLKGVVKSIDSFGYDHIKFTQDYDIDSLLYQKNYIDTFSSQASQVGLQARHSTLNALQSFCGTAGDTHLKFEKYAPHLVRAVDDIRMTIFLLEKETEGKHAHVLSMLIVILENELKVSQLQRNFTKKVEFLLESANKFVFSIITEDTKGDHYLITDDSMFIDTDQTNGQSELDKIRSRVTEFNTLLDLVLAQETTIINQVSDYILANVFMHAGFDGVDQGSSQRRTVAEKYVTHSDQIGVASDLLWDQYSELVELTYNPVDRADRMTRLAAVTTALADKKAELETHYAAVNTEGFDFEQQADKAGRYIVKNFVPEESLSTSIVDYTMNEGTVFNEWTLKEETRYSTIVLLDPVESTAVAAIEDILKPTKPLKKVKNFTPIPHLRLQYEQKDTTIYLGKQISNPDQLYTIELRPKDSNPIFTGLGYAVQSTTDQSYHLNGLFFKRTVDAVTQMQLASYKTEKEFIVLLIDPVKVFEIKLKKFDNMLHLRPTVASKNLSRISLHMPWGMLVKTAFNEKAKKDQYVPLSPVNKIFWLDEELNRLGKFEFSYTPAKDKSLNGALGFSSFTPSLNADYKMMKGVYFDGKNVFYHPSAAFASEKSFDGTIYMQIHLLNGVSSFVLFWTSKDNNAIKVHFYERTIMVGILHSAVLSGKLEKKKKGVLTDVTATKEACSGFSDCVTGVCFDHEYGAAYGYCESGIFTTMQILLILLSLMLAFVAVGFGIYHLCTRIEVKQPQYITQTDVSEASVDDNTAKPFGHNNYDYLN